MSMVGEDPKHEQTPLRRKESVQNDTAQRRYITHHDAWDTYCKAWRECFPNSKEQPSLSVAALAVFADMLLADGGSTKPDTATVTDTMLSAARRAEPKVGREACLRIYRAMLAAVPSPEEGR